MKHVLFILFLAACYSCGSSSIAFDYDSEIDFSEYKTYNFYPTIQSGLEEWEDGAIMHVCDSIFGTKQITASENPQLYINFYAEESISDSRNTIAIGFGNMSRNSSVGISGGIPIGGKQIQQILKIDIIDVSKDILIWQTSIRSSFKQNISIEKLQALYKKNIWKALEVFPPDVEKK